MQTQNSPRPHQPVAPLIGPFAQPWFIETVWRHAPAPGGRLVPLSDENGSIFLVEQEESRRISLVGHEDLVDYRSPVGEVDGILSRYLSQVEAGWSINFDSLPEEAVGPFQSVLGKAGIQQAKSRHGSTAVIELPTDYDSYLTLVGKKERHEIRRKMRRFQSVLGVPHLDTHQGKAGVELERFFAFHRRSVGPKGRFMTPTMEAYFTDLLTGEGWRLDTLVSEKEGLVAAAFSYVDDQGYYLYNSAYHPDFAHASPGMVLMAKLIEHSINQEMRVFDFLKGEETYKYRLGAHPRLLYVVEGVA